MPETQKSLDALNAEVTSVKDDIKDLTHSVRSLMQALRDEATQFTKLSGRVTTVEKSVGDLSDQIKELLKEMKQSARTPWGLIVSFISASYMLGGGLGYLVLKPIDAGLERLTQNIKSVSDDVVPRSEHVQRWQQGADSLNRLQASTDRALDQVTRRLERLEDKSRR